MGNINISIKEEAYRFLKSLKSKDRSFSDVILNFREKKGNKDNIMRFFGALKDEKMDWEEKAKRMKEFRESFDRRINETVKYMKKVGKEK